MKAYITEYFIERAEKVYGNKYNYSNTKYNGANSPLIITCPIHGDFKIRPSKFLNGRECQECKIKKTASTRRLTTEQFIENAKAIHGDRYDYSKVNYINQKTKVILICQKHGEFNIVPNYHLTDKCGCVPCGKESYKEKATYTKERFIEEAIKKHGHKYDYSKVLYLDIKTPVIIICPIHGEHLQTPFDHLRTFGCIKCGHESAVKLTRHSQEIFIENAIKIHGNIYDYSLTNYSGSGIKIDILCKSHGIFKQVPYSHLMGRGCPICSTSKGELKISALLNSKNIKFETQKKFDECKNKRKLPFDFYLPDFNICIEFQGRQHYSSCYFGGNEGLLSREKNDNIKKIFCKENNIELLEIKYDENIETKLQSIIN